MRANKETLPFEKAIEAEEERCTGERERLVKDPYFVPRSYQLYSYIARGHYADQLENWFRYYNRKQFLILATEDLRKSPQRILDQVFGFLEVPPSLRVENLRDRNVGNYKKINEGTRKLLIEYFKPHNERLYKLLQRNFDWDK